MPVRVKQRALESADPIASTREWDELRRDLAALVLAWPHTVTLTVKDVSPTARSRTIRLASSPNEKLKGSKLCLHVSSVLYQAKFISDPSPSAFVSASGHTSTVRLNAAISLDPAPNKSVQFISFGISPVSNTDGRNVLYEEINRLFVNSTFGQLDDLPMLNDREKKRRAEDRRYKSDGFTQKELKGGGKGVDRWPIFFIRIDIMESKNAKRRLMEDDVLENETKLNSIIKLLQAVIVEWLKSNHFVPKHIRRQKSPKKRDRDATQPVDEKKDSSTPTSNFVKARSSLLDIPTGESRNEKTDALGAGLMRTGSPFDIWPRVKSGRGIVRKPFVEVSQSVPGTPSMSGLVAPATPVTSAAIATPSDASKTQGTIVSKSGTIIRLPFLDVETPITNRRSRTPRPSTLSHPAIVEPETRSEGVISKSVTELQEKEEIVSWINPADKKEVFINKRTGLMVDKAKHLSRTNSEDGSQQRETSFSTRLTTTHLASNPIAPGSQPQGPFVSSLLESWRNPVFALSETPIPLASNASTEDAETHAILHGHKHNCSELDIDRAFRAGALASGEIGRLSKTSLARAEVVSQVDGKFILAKLDEVLVLIDQHAADERIRVESLMEEFFEPPSEPFIPALIFGGETVVPGVKTTRLEVPMRFDVDILEGQKLAVRKDWFAAWGILFVVKSINAKLSQVLVTDLPPALVERCKLIPKLLIELIRKELHASTSSSAIPSVPVSGVERTDQSRVGDVGEEGKDEGPLWLRRLHNCPRGILDMINSRACRSAIMFNDQLSLSDCQELILKLSRTCFPFICAHGRPSMAPLVDLRSVGVWTGDSE